VELGSGERAGVEGARVTPGTSIKENVQLLSNRKKMTLTRESCLWEEAITWCKRIPLLFGWKSRWLSWLTVVQKLPDFVLMFRQAPQYAIDETGGAVGPKSLGEFNCLIDRHLDRCPLLPGKFPGGDSQDVSVNRRDLVKRPLRRIPGKYGIQEFPQWQNAKKNLAGELCQFLGLRFVNQAIL
jgi:hypothetical protein